jgi:hypothetical protein
VKIIVANGKSFILVNVAVFGGLGVAIALRLTLFLIQKIRMFFELLMFKLKQLWV